MKISSLVFFAAFALVNASNEQIDSLEENEKNILPSKDTYSGLSEDFYSSQYLGSDNNENSKLQIVEIDENDLRYTNTKRLLKRGGGGGRSSSRSSSSRSSSSRSSGSRSRTTTTRRTVTTNKTWNSSTGRTYAPLVAGFYFRPIGVYLMYYSYYYGHMYYDGYGWNFYTQSGGYYDGASKGGSSAGIIIAVIIVICCCCCIVGYAFSRNQEGEEEVHVEETVVVEEVYHDDDDGYDKGTAYPPGMGPGSAPSQYPPGTMPAAYGGQQQVIGQPPMYPPGQMPPQYPPGQMPPQGQYMMQQPPMGQMQGGYPQMQQPGVYGQQPMQYQQ